MKNLLKLVGYKMLNLNLKNIGIYLNEKIKL